MPAVTATAALATSVDVSVGVCVTDTSNVDPLESLSSSVSAPVLLSPLWSATLGSTRRTVDTPSGIVT